MCNTAQEHVVILKPCLILEPRSILDLVVMFEFYFSLDSRLILERCFIFYPGFIFELRSALEPYGPFRTLFHFGTFKRNRHM